MYCRVVYISLHRHDHTEYWPHEKEADCYEVGKGKGEGTTVHVAWNKASLGFVVLARLISDKIPIFLMSFRLAGDFNCWKCILVAGQVRTNGWSV